MRPSPPTDAHKIPLSGNCKRKKVLWGKNEEGNEKAKIQVCDKKKYFLIKSVHHKT